MAVKYRYKRSKGLAAANKAMAEDFKKALDEIGIDAFKGARKAGLFIQGEAQEITPQKTGTLVNSAFTDSERTKKKFRVRVGFTAKYAPHVHEMPDPKVTQPGGFALKVRHVNWTKKGTGNKFLEKAVVNNLKKILDIIWFSARLKK